MKLQGRVVATGLKFPEGPIAMEDGSVLVTEIQGGTLTRILPSGELQVVADVGGVLTFFIFISIYWKESPRPILRLWAIRSIKP